jgi:hypothetical protein
MNPLVENQLVSIAWLEGLRLACNGTGIKGKCYRLVARLCPVAIKMYGKYNEFGVIAVPALFELQKPSAF